MRACRNARSGLVLSLLLAACAGAPVQTNPAPGCYRPNWPIPFKIEKLQRIAQEPFTMHTGSQRFLTIYSPGPFDRSFFFVMSPEPSDGSVAMSEHFGVMADSDRIGKADCFILNGGTLPDADGEPVVYNFFAIDQEGDGEIDEFISEDLDLDGNQAVDRNVQAILMERDPEGHFRRGAYLVRGKIVPIPKDGNTFLLKKPLYKDGYPFPDDEVTRMMLFSALHKMWDDLQRH